MILHRLRVNVERVTRNASAVQFQQVGIAAAHHASSAKSDGQYDGKRTQIVINLANHPEIKFYGESVQHGEPQPPSPPRGALGGPAPEMQAVSLLAENES